MEFDPDWILLHGHGRLAINKPPGLALHAGTGHADGLVELIEA